MGGKLPTHPNVNIAILELNILLRLMSYEF